MNTQFALSTINFHGDEIIAYKDDETEKVFVNLRGICESLGLNFSGQRQKLVNDSVYEDNLVRVDIHTEAGKRKSLFLDAEYLHGWLFSIQTNRLKPEIREKHIRYKKECFRVLNEYFTKGFSVNEAALKNEAVLDQLTEKVYDRLLGRFPPAATRRGEAASRSTKTRMSDVSVIEQGILEAVSEDEKTTQDLYRYFHNNVNAKILNRALANLQRAGLIILRKKSNQSKRGRKPIIIYLP